MKINQTCFIEKYFLSLKFKQFDAVLTIHAAFKYPYLIAYVNELYIPSSRAITIIYSGIGVAAILLSISTAMASFRTVSNYSLIVSILLISILVYVHLCDLG